MAEDTRQFIPFLRTLHLFARLSDGELEAIASRFTLRTLEVGEALFTGRPPEDEFYIIRSGTIVIRYGKEGSEDRSLTPGEYFTEEDLLYNQPEAAIITARESSELLHLGEKDFYNLLAEYPQVKPELARTEEARQIVQRQGFDWLGEDEVIYFLARKHEAILLFNLLGPLVAFLISILLVFQVSSSALSSGLWVAGVVFASLLALASLLWGVWKFIDWGNDYYIVTNQRAVWVEKVIWLYESRDEAPLNTILAINTRAPFIGRLLGFGSVVVRTFTGEITFKNLPNPNRMAGTLEEYRQRLEKSSERLEKRQIDQAMRQRLWSEKTGEDKPPASERQVLKPPRSNPFHRFFKNFFTMRYEEGVAITYRKYWPTLLGKIWLPSTLFLLVLIFLIYLANRFRLGTTSLQSLETFFILGLFFSLLVLLPWWVYQYVDWRNDIYQVTDKYVFDIERRPLGTEVKKSAPLENILSLEHERVGFLGYVLNYGFVTINVGETQFIFRDVHEPARVQQDIFNRLYAQRRQKEQAEAAKDRRHLVDVIEIYHQNAGEYDQDDLFGDYDQDFGVELGSDGYP